MSSIADISEVLLELGLSASVSDEERAVATEQLRRAEGAIKHFLKYDPVQRERTEYYPQQDFVLPINNTIFEISGESAVLRHVNQISADVLFVRHIPVRTIANLWIDYDGRSGSLDTAFGDATLKVEGTDYWPNYDIQDGAGKKVCRDGMLRSIGIWPSEPGNVKIKYTAGYTEAEFRGEDAILDASPIWRSVVIEAARRVRAVFASRKHGAIGFTAGHLVKERMGDYAYELGTGKDSPAAIQFGGTQSLLPETEQVLQDFINHGYILAG